MATYKRTIYLNGEVELRSEVVQTRNRIRATHKHLCAIKVGVDHIAAYADVALRTKSTDYLEVRYVEITQA